MRIPIKPTPAVNAVIIDDRGLVLLTKRSSRVRAPGKWCLPGGHLDGGEQWKAAVSREVFEETGLMVKQAELVGIYSDPSLTVAAELSPDGCYRQYVVASFLVREYEGEIGRSEEVEDWGWFSPEELPSPILRSHPIRIEDAFRFNGKVFVR